MMNKMPVSFALMICLALAPLDAYALSSASYKIVVNALGSGGGGSGSASYKVSQLSGQPSVIGEVESGSFRLGAGYYYILALEQLLNKKANCIAIGSSALFAGFDGDGIYKSTDSGATWTAATTQPGNQWIRGLVMHPITLTALYAATYGGGIYKSTDSGDNWSACANTGLGSLNATSLATDPTGKLYAGTEAGIYTSTDCDTWSATDGTLPASSTTPPAAIAIDTTTVTNIYAGLDGGGIYRSANSGVTWTAATTQPTNLNIKTLVIRPGDSTDLYAATYGGGVFKSIDSGVTWSVCANTNLTNMNVISLTIDATGRLYAGTEAGVFVSTDGCGTWTAVNNGLPN